MSRPGLTSADILAAGWGGLRDLEGRMQVDVAASGEARKTLAAQAAIAFSTPEGKAIIEWLMDQTVRRSPVPNFSEVGLAVTYEQLAPAMTWHAAQMALVQKLARLVDEGNSTRRG